MANAGRRKIVIAQQARFASSNEVCVEAEVTVVLLDEKTGRPAPLSDEICHAWLELSVARE